MNLVDIYKYTMRLVLVCNTSLKNIMVEEKTIASGENVFIREDVMNMINSMIPGYPLKEVKSGQIDHS